MIWIPLRKKLHYISFILISAAVISCSVVPVTGRRQISILPESEMISMGIASYQEFMKENPPSPDKINSTAVREVGTNISNSVEFFFAAKSMQSRFEGYEWSCGCDKS